MGVDKDDERSHLVIFGEELFEYSAIPGDGEWALLGVYSFAGCIVELQFEAMGEFLDCMFLDERNRGDGNE